MLAGEGAANVTHSVFMQPGEFKSIRCHRDRTRLLAVWFRGNRSSDQTPQEPSEHPACCLAVHHAAGQRCSSEGETGTGRSAPTGEPLVAAGAAAMGWVISVTCLSEGLCAHGWVLLQPKRSSPCSAVPRHPCFSFFLGFLFWLLVCFIVV